MLELSVYRYRNENFVIAGKRESLIGYHVICGEHLAVVTISQSALELGCSILNVFKQFSNLPPKMTQEEERNNPKFWTVATKERGWRTFAKKADLVDIRCTGKRFTCTLWERQLDCSFDPNSNMDPIVLQEPTAEELGAAVMKLFSLTG